MKKTILMVAISVMLVSSTTYAELVRGIDIDFVTISNAGNLADSSGFGSVGYEYKIGKYEVTNLQWDIFVSAAGPPAGNPSNNYGNHSAYVNNAYWTGTSMPTNNISWLEAAQFCNYLTSGDKSLGAYQFNGINENPGDFLGIDRDLSVSIYGTTYVIPTENEWYKAAYYKPNGSGYSKFANGKDIAPVAGVHTNYEQYTPFDGPWAVGTGMIEQNGTFDMMGNVWEWDETLTGSNSGIRGGGYSSHGSIESYFRSIANTNGEYDFMGFRVAVIPEPATLLLLGFGGMAVRRKQIY